MIHHQRVLTLVEELLGLRLAVVVVDWLDGVDCKLFSVVTVGVGADVTTATA
jgi:hypothetical protein